MAKQTAEQKDATVEALAQDIGKAQGLQVTPDLVALIAAAVSAAVREANRNPEEEAEKERIAADRQRVRDEEEQRIANIKARQDMCPHLDAYENYAFVGQRNCAGQVVFVCTQCFRPFKPEDPDYTNYARFLKWDRIGNARQL